LHILGKFKAKGKAGMKKGRVVRPCGGWIFRLKPLPSLQPMERRRPADIILPARKACRLATSRAVPF
jgi:hypothetical protein